MKHSRIRKGKFDIVRDGKYFEVFFFDSTGMSMLSKTRTLREAKKRMTYHMNRFKKGHLLKEDKSVWKVI
jgi:hypothetical protein